MNIRDARQEIIHTIKAYTSKNSDGSYRIPLLRQRPILLIGPPGIGKTAVMEQAALASGVGFVSYTMTHHTRQSAIGLPFIERQNFGGREYAVTEYTMSEIIASVYRCIEENGHSEGLLFLDEINCVSETLAPAMLQFLQNKMFGNHRLPDGWILAAAGNPPEYNKSVREFDIATLDRLKYITIEADYPAWRAYALEMNIHGAILSYLDTRPEQFYLLKQTHASKSFVTARGWEDLSCILLEYEKLALPVTSDLIAQYLHNEALAQDFGGFYYLYAQRQKALPVAQMLNGNAGAADACHAWMQQAPSAEQIYFVQLMLSHIGGLLQSWKQAVSDQKQFTSVLDRLERYRKQAHLSALSDAVPGFLEKEEEILRIRREHGLSTESELRQMQQALYLLQKLGYQMQADHVDASFAVKELNDTAASRCILLADMLNRGMQFLTEAGSPVRAFFLAALQQNALAVQFLKLHMPDFQKESSEQLDFSRREEALKI